MGSGGRAERLLTVGVGISYSLSVRARAHAHTNEAKNDERKLIGTCKSSFAFLLLCEIRGSLAGMIPSDVFEVLHEHATCHFRSSIDACDHSRDLRDDSCRAAIARTHATYHVGVDEDAADFVERRAFDFDGVLVHTAARIFDQHGAVVVLHGVQRGRR